MYNNTATMMDLLSYDWKYNRGERSRFDFRRSIKRDTKLYLNPDMNRSTAAFIMGYLRGGLNRKVHHKIERSNYDGRIRVVPDEYEYLYFSDPYDEDSPTDYSIYDAIRFKMSFYTEPVDMDNDIVNTYYMCARNTIGSITYDENGNNVSMDTISTDKNASILIEIKRRSGCYVDI